MPMLELGSQLGHYEILATLGSGGMGEVYRGRDLRLGRMVAIKVMSALIQYDADHVARFRQEASALSALNHPNIVTVYDIEQQGPLTYIVMELVRGQPLRALLQAGALPLRMTLRVGAQVAEALTNAHEAGVVHRDLKPENVMVTDDGVVKLLDFGLAKVAARTTDETLSPVTQPGAVVGTATYMAPEQIRGTPADFRADQFALGLLLFEMASGQHPFRRETWLSTLSAIVTDAPTSLAGVNVNIPPPLVWVVERCLAKSPAERYAATREIARNLLAIEQQMSSGSSAIPLQRPRASRAAIDSIAVLPFENAAATADLEYLCDGLTEDIIGNLSPMPRLRVMARSTVFRYAGSALTPQQIGTELGVVAVLTGRVIVRGDHVTASAELVRVVDGSRIWGGQFTRPWSDVMTIEREMSDEITTALRLRLTPTQRRQLARHQTASTDAYQLYLRGRYFLNKRTLDAVRKSIEQFQEAIDLDPQFARAYAGLADSYIVLGTGGFGVVPSRDALTRASAAASRAIELDDRLAEAHRSLGHVHLMYTWDASASVREFERAIQLDPGAGMTHSWYAEVCTVRGRYDEGLAAARRGMELEPLSINATFYLMRVLYYARQYEAVIEEGRKAMELDPSYYRTNLMVAPAYQMLGRGPEAIALVDNFIAGAGGSPFLSALRADLLARSGDADTARAILADVLDLSKSRYVDPYDIARVYIGLGDRGPAFEWLARAFEARSTWLIWLAVSPFSDVIRDDPRFAEQVAQIGLTS